MNPAMRSQYHNIHHLNPHTPAVRRGGIVPKKDVADRAAPIAPNPQAQRDVQMRERQAQENRESREREMAQRRASKPSDKNMPDGVDKLIVGDGVQQYKSMRDVERRLDAIMMRKRLDLLDKRHKGSRQYKTMRIWISNTVDLQPWQGKGEDEEMYDFSGSSEGIYRMKIEGRLLDDKDDDLSDDGDSDAEQEERNGEAVEQDGNAVQKPITRAGARPKTKLSHFFKSITVEFDRNKNVQGDYATQIEWKRPQYDNDAPLPPAADFDSLEFERKGDSDFNCTVHLYRDDERFLLSDPLAEILDSKEEDRESVISALWDYIKAMNLQQDDEKRAVQCDDRLRKVSPKTMLSVLHLRPRRHLHPRPPRPPVNQQ
ncbi:MAG: hypothetical protein Q9196_004129 [Gyalolechia fulgens]